MDVYMCIIIALLTLIVTAITLAEIKDLRRSYNFLMTSIESQLEISRRITDALSETREYVRSVIKEQEVQRAAIKLLLEEENKRREKEKTHD